MGIQVAMAGRNIARAAAIINKDYRKSIMCRTLRSKDTPSVFEESHLLRERRQTHEKIGHPQRPLRVQLQGGRSLVQPGQLRKDSGCVVKR